jgi:rhamnosyltransferase
MNVSIAIPTFNGGDVWRKSAEALRIALENSDHEVKKVLVVDSSSSDSTGSIARECGFDLHIIKPEDFNHGGTRNLLVNLLQGDIVIFLTQDAIVTSGFLDELLNAFNNQYVAIAYGRQTSHDDANPLARHARLFNYRETSYISDLESKSKMGIKTVFTSNSFSAYRVSVFKSLGGFPENTILSEDMFLAAKAVMKGYKIAYVSEAIVQHSHNYTALEEFKRYFDIGVFHHSERWIRECFGGAGGEGIKFIKSECEFLMKNNPFWIPKSFIHSFCKIAGYKLGQHYKKIPSRWIPLLSMHKRFW